MNARNPRNAQGEGFRVPGSGFRVVAFALITMGAFMAGCVHVEMGAAPAMPRLAQAPVLMPVAADPTVSFRIAFAVGSQNDPAGKEGLAALTAAMMAEGATTRRSYPEILKALYPMAAEYSVRVDREVITFSGRVHKDNLVAYTELLLDAILRPAFTAADFERLRQRTLDGLTKTLRYASDEELGKAVLYASAFAGTPYSHPEVGTVAGLGAITLDDVRAFWRASFTRDSVVLGLGGGYDPALPARLERELAALPASAPPAPELKVPASDHRRVVIVEKPGPATAISFGFPIAVGRRDEDFAALWLATSWLGEHRNSSSHLYQVIREARGMNYGDYAYIEWFPEGGRRDVPPTGVPRRHQLFEVWIRPVPSAQAHFALRAAMREVERLAKDGLTREQFELTRQYLLKYSLHYADTTFMRLGYAVDDRFYGVPTPGHLERLRQSLAGLTLERVNAAIARHLRPERALIALVTQDAGSLADAIAGETPSPITYATPKPAEVLAEDTLIEVYPLGIARDAITIVPVDEVFAR